MMKKITISSLILITFSSCSLIERQSEDPQQPIGANMSNSEESSQVAGRDANEYLERELSRVSAKLEALETKVDVLATNMEKQNLKAAQPVIEAEPQTHASTPSMPTHGSEFSGTPVTIHSPTQLAPSKSKAMASKDSSKLQGPELDFKHAMELFQNGKNLEAGVSFVNFARENPQHHLASHALYWAGEASARAEQWKMAISDWEELKSKYPKSAYTPEAMAGLTRAYAATGETGKADAARLTLLQTFPQAPASLSLQSTSPTITKPSSLAHVTDEVPAEATAPQRESAADTADEHGAKNELDNIEAPFKEQPLDVPSENSEE